MKYIGLMALIFLAVVACEQKPEDIVHEYTTPFESSDSTETATYNEAIDFYIKLAKDFPEINIQTIGKTDSGLPLHMVTYNKDGDFNFQRLAKEKVCLLINNGIHPGESDGIDATMLLFRDLAIGKLASPEHVVVVTIPIYNVGGALNRNSTTRANQNGPASYGFRGNARNYDLNRDFIKADTKNAQTFSEIFHLVNPDLFIDTHVSNGADYQYTLTHLFTQHNKLGGKLGAYLHQELMPDLEADLANKNWDITPYVNVFNRVPESGFSQFFDSPRYSTGYTTLWNTLGMMVETHMLKPYDKRVLGTYELLESMLGIAETDHEKIKALRLETIETMPQMEQYHLNWQIDTTKVGHLDFKGYEADTLTSEVTGLNRLKYDRKKPFTKKVVYQNHFVPVDTIDVPFAYIIKKPWRRVLERLEWNQIDFFELEQDTVLEVETYRIKDYQTLGYAYEGHYLHYNTKVEKKVEKVPFKKGDIVVPTQQPGVRYLLETLEPEARDSFFNWNFFDSILQQKEGFSPYVFEDTALKLLHEDEPLRNLFLQKKATDSSFAQNWYAQLDWVYKQSPHYEKAHLQYPVYRILKNGGIPDFLKAN
ncbi:MAG: hypothetical protein CMH48_12205 [Muricauda sp.]|nr:M14 family metallopeptidase [Allomuricauda sp.]MBC31594.1 hypothetical protein [Allomuricauda sp.]